MEILLVNDDGIYSEGILALARALKGNHHVTIVAPHKQMSGTSHALTMNAYLNFQPLEIMEGVASYVLSGTPADCSKFGIEVIVGHKPDLVLSGINKGYNLGSDVLYSGTVNAAIEASALGVKSIAISQDYMADNFDKAAEYIACNLEKLTSMLPDDNRTILSINFPIVDVANGYKGAKVTTVGWRIYEDEYKYNALKGYYITGQPILTEDKLPHSDESAVESDYISISPIKADFNDYALFEKIKNILI